MRLKHFKLLVLTGLVVVLLGSGCSSNYASSSANGQPTEDGRTIDPANSKSVSSTLTVFAAASLTGAFQEIGQAYEAANPGVRVSFNFAGSQILSTQLEQGAQADVFASADQKNMDLLVSDRFVVAVNIAEFARNSLIVILPASNPGKVVSMVDLARPGLKLILADVSVPAGNYARQALAKMSQDPAYGSDFSSRVLANLVSNETDVKQVVTKIELGEADAGIVYKTDALASPGLDTLTIPAEFNVLVSYPISVLADAPDPELARSFVAYVSSSAGQAILAKWGFDTTAR